MESYMYQFRNTMAAALCLLPIVSQAEHPQTAPMPGFEVAGELKAGEVKGFGIPSFVHKVKATCKLKTHGQTVKLKAHLKSGEGSLDGKPYYGGETIAVIANDNDKFVVTGKGGSEGNLVLLKEGDVKSITATCSVSF